MTFLIPVYVSMRSSWSSEKTKVKQKKGLWSPDEDEKLRDYVTNHGLGFWSCVPIHAGLQRSGKSCRLRWINYLRPGLKRGSFSLHEEEVILTLHRMLGNKWSQMSQHLPGRTDNEIKNHWHSHMKKKLKSFENMKPQTPLTDSSCRNLPKILFADWLSGTNSQKTLVNEGCSVEEGWSYDDFTDSQLKYENQYYDLISEDQSICQSFNNSDVTILYSSDEL